MQAEHVLSIESARATMNSVYFWLALHGIRALVLTSSSVHPYVRILCESFNDETAIYWNSKKCR